MRQQTLADDLGDTPRIGRPATVVTEDPGINDHHVGQGGFSDLHRSYSSMASR